MPLFVLGLNHQTAPLAIREKVAFAPETLTEALIELKQKPAIAEAAILSTCNRAEVYLSADSPDIAIAWLAQFHGVESTALEPYLYAHNERDAIRHAFRVAAGLDSMVVGEPQILGQMKEAARAAESAGTLGLMLNRLFQQAFSVAKDVRSQTAIGEASVSMAAAAVRLSERIFPDLSENAILFVGAGEMIELAAAHFCSRNPKKIMFANRTIERGQILAERFGGSAIRLEQLSDTLSQYDLVVSSTASQLPIIGLGMVERAIRVRKHRPMFMCDLAVPRDIELEVGKLDDVFLYTVDDLSTIVQAGFEARKGAVEAAEAIISTGTDAFVEWLAGRERVPAIRSLRERAQQSREQEVERALKMLERGESPQKVVEALSIALTNKFLHAPTSALSRASEEEQDKLMQWVETLYQHK